MRDAGAERGLDRRQVAPADVIGVAAEVFRREFPVARHDPFMAADDLDAALAAIEEGVEIPRGGAEIVRQRRRLGIERGEPQPLVLVELRYRHEAPVLPVKFVVVGLLEIRHAGELAVIAVGPAVIGAGEAGGVASVGAAEPVATVAADVEESTDLAGGVAHHKHWVFGHPGGEKVARQRDLAVMAEEEPAARKDPRQLLIIDLRLDKDAAAEKSVRDIDQRAVHDRPPSGKLRRL